MNRKGEKRAEYGKELLKRLAAQLTEEFGKGFSRTNLQAMRNFFLAWQDREPKIDQTSSRQFQVDQICRKPSGKLALSEKDWRKSPFTLSWSHYVLLLTIKKPEECSFYEIESTRAGWSLPELKREVASCLYERLAIHQISRSGKPYRAYCSVSESTVGSLFFLPLSDELYRTWIFGHLYIGRQ